MNQIEQVLRIMLKATNNFKRDTKKLKNFLRDTEGETEALTKEEIFRILDIIEDLDKMCQNKSTVLDIEMAQEETEVREVCEAKTDEAAREYPGNGDIDREGREIAESYWKDFEELKQVNKQKRLELASLGIRFNTDRE